MKICLVNNLLGPWSRGGAEKIVEALAEAIIAEGHEVVFISTKPKGEATPAISQPRHYYLSSYYYHLNKRSQFFRLVWHLISLMYNRHQNELKNILTKESPDLIITNNLMGLGYDIGVLAQTLKIKHWHILHDAQLLHPSGLIMYGHIGELATMGAKIYQRLTRVRLGQPEAVICASEWLVRQHQRRGFFLNTPIHYLLNPVSGQWPKPQAINSEGHFLFVGQVEKHKGIKLLLSAWTEFIARTKVETNLVIVGEGALLEELKKNNHAQVEFRGKLLGEDLVKAYQEAVCLVVPSLCYEKPTVIYEAGRLHLPAIASSLGGMKELLDKDYLFKPETTYLTEKLLWVYKNRNELLAPKIKLINGEDYWQSIKQLL